MADVLHRTTRRYLKSVNTPDYPPADYIINPDMTAVQGFHWRYWKINGDAVALMTQAERDAVDAALVEQLRDGVVAELDIPEGLQRAVLGVILDEINIVRAAVSLAPRTPAQMRAAVRAKLGT